MAIGKVLPENKIPFREAAGMTTDSKGKEYELTTTLSGAPIVRLPNGRFVTYSWQDILNDAIESFELYEKEKTTDRRQAKSVTQ